MAKPIVKYDNVFPAFINVGKRALIKPVDHPSDRVSNTKEVLTSKVLSYNRVTGEFETMNTLYKPCV